MWRGVLNLLKQALGWLLFPLVPAMLATSYYATWNLAIFTKSQYGPDPYQWEWWSWTLQLGPLLGYGFLAGATLRLADVPTRRGWRAWFANPTFWVAIGPLLPWLTVVAVIVLWGIAEDLVGWRSGGSREPAWNPTQWTPRETWLSVLWTGTLCGVMAYGWLLIAGFAIRQARRQGQAWRALSQGLLTAIGFVGSLFATFWAATSAWRSYFFDTTIVRLLLIVLVSTPLSSGCASEAVGDLRRREFFSALLVAWVIGLAIVWWLWSRRRESSKH